MQGFLRLLLATVMVAAYIVPGLVGHDPWKQDETYSFGMIHHVLRSGDWVVPEVAQEPFMEKPPLFYLSAAAMARLNDGWLPLHDGARLATGAYFALACLFLVLTSRSLFGPGKELHTLLPFLGCLGLLEVRFLFTDVALLAGCCIGLYGLALALEQGRRAGLVLGTGVGMALMSKGLLVPATFALTVLLLPLVSPAWRTRRYLQCLGFAALAVLPWALVWPLALYLRSHALFMEWFWMNNVGRFLGFSVKVLGADHESGFWPRTIPWHTFPVLPLALYTLWRYGRSAPRRPVVALGLGFTVALYGLLFSAASARALYALPALPALALLATEGCEGLPAGVRRAWDLGGRVLLGLPGLALWALWAYVHWSPPPHPWVHFLGRYLPLDYTLPFVAWQVELAAALSLLWLAVPWLDRGQALRGALGWAAGVALVSGLAFTLLLPWVDTAKSYREMFTGLARALPAGHGCVASYGLGESERAMLDYVAGVITLRREAGHHEACDWVLVQGKAADPGLPPGGPWLLRWEGSRRGDTVERHRLWQRAASVPATAARSPAAPVAAPPARLR